MKTLLLWDIDGTLINSGGAGMRALQHGLRKAFGIDGSLEDIDFAGRTDRWIFRKIFAKFELPATEENFTKLFDGYVSSLPAELKNPAARVLPGVRKLLDSFVDHPHAVQGLLTGNIRRGAEVKLGFHGLWDYFPFGAFADDAELRNDLGPHALRRARDHAKWEFAGERVWVIGDTPHDIACGKIIGARTLAVATGHCSAADLAAHQPTALWEDLNDHDAFLKLVLS